MTDPPSPSPPPDIVKPKMSPVFRIVIAVVGIAAVVVGIRQMKEGIGEMKGPDPEVVRLLEEADAAVALANQSGLEAQPLFQASLDAVDRDGLDAVRAQLSDETQTAAGLMAKAAEQFQLAAEKVDAATAVAALEPEEKIGTALDFKADAYRKYAQSRAINRDIALMVLDEKITTIDQLTPRVLEAAQRRDEFEAAANKAAVEADALAEASKR